MSADAPGSVEDLLRRGPLGELLAGGDGERVSQSSASQAVHQLEVRLGVKLIDRSKRPLVLDAAGQGLLRGMQGPGRAATWRWRTGSRRWRTRTTWSGRSGWPRSIRSGLHHMSRYVQTFDERYPGANVRLEYLHPTRVVESVSERGGRARPDLVSPQVARAEGDPLARGGDGPGRPSLAPVRRAGEHRRRASSTARRSSASMPMCRSAGRSTGSCGITMSTSRWHWSSITSRTSNAPSRSPRAWRSCPSRPWRARWRRDARRGPDRRPGPPSSSDASAGDHPPAEPAAQLDGVAVPEAADRRGRADAGRAPRMPPGRRTRPDDPRGSDPACRGAERREVRSAPRPATAANRVRRRRRSRRPIRLDGDLTDRPSSPTCGSP